MRKVLLAACAAILLLAGCKTGTKAPALKSGLDKAAFDTTINGMAVSLYTLVNKSGMEVDLTNYGARIVSIMVPDRDGVYRDVSLGFDTIKEYADSVNTPSNFGAVVGRYANRIAKGRFSIGDETYQLPLNNHGNCLHGGFDSWYYRPFEAEQISDTQIKFTVKSPDGDSHFPGNVTATVTYTLTEDNRLDILYGAVTDKPTVVNMTNHCYFNLNADGSKSIEDNVLYVNADYITPTDDLLIPVGGFLALEGTPMDFRKAKSIGSVADDKSFVPLVYGKGLDHNFCLNTYKDGKGDDTVVAGSLYSPKTGIKLDVYTDEPGLQVYTGNFLNGSIAGKGGVRYVHRAACCLESQKYPDTPNHPEWPSALLNPGEKYSSHCVYAFSVVK